jgi:Domain of unknown function (DUF4282)
MTSDDLRKIFIGPTLFRLDTILSPRLVPVLYAVGMAALLLWAIIHLFATFSVNFGDGLWGLLEIAVFGTLGLLLLRVLCEVLLVFFKTHEATTRTVNLSLIPASLVDDVKEAIHDIADEEPEVDADAVATTAAPKVRRTARRAPPTIEPPPDVAS